MKEIPTHHVYLVIPFGCLMMMHSNIVHGGSFGSCSNTWMHLTMNMRTTIESTQNLDCVFSATEGQLHHFHSYLECFESHRIPDQPTYGED